MVIKCPPLEPSPQPGGLGGKTQTPDTQGRIPPKAWLPELSPTVLLAEGYRAPTGLCAGQEPACLILRTGTKGRGRITPALQVRERDPEHLGDHLSSGR